MACSQRTSLNTLLCSAALITLWLSLFVSSSTVEEHFSHVPLKEIFWSILKSCAKKTGASPENIKELHDYRNIEPTKAAKCMLNCAMRTYGSLNEDGSSATNALDLYYSAAFKPEQHDQVMVLWNGCFNTVDKHADPCEYSYTLIMCFMRSVNDAKIHVVPFW